MDIPPSFRSEIYYLMAQFLAAGPCQNAATALRQDLEQHQLVPQRYDWKGDGHPKTFRDMEDEYGKVPDEFLLQKCFDLVKKLNPGSSSVRSMFQRGQKLQHRPKFNVMQRLSSNQIGRTDNGYQSNWHSHLAKGMKLLRRTFGHLSSIYCLIFDRSGQLVITGADDMLVKVWSFIDARLIHTFRGASAEISDLAVSPDNKLIAAGSCDKVIRVWELHTGSPVAVLTKHTGIVTAINFCPFLLNETGSRYLASTSGDGTVSFWRYTYNEHGHTNFDPQPTRHHEKIRPGNAQMICADFSPGGVFFVVGSADMNVRVYQMNGPEGAVRILEEELHEDRVESIQWCHTPHELRFISGSRDGTARIWTYTNQRWRTLVLNMRTGDNQELSKKKEKAVPVATTTSRSGRTTTSVSNADQNNDHASSSSTDQDKKTKGVTMVAWSLDDSLAITAVADWTLKIWDSHKGTLISTLSGHENDIFVLEPHPIAMNLLLTAAHDGQVIVWDLEKKSILFKHRNMITDNGNSQGHGPVFDAKWSKDGATICASDSHGHVLFISHGSNENYNKCPTELFFHSDYRPLLRDSFHNVVDEQTQLPPHLLPPPFLVDSEGDPYPAFVQRLVRGREQISERDGLVPIGPEPSFQAPHQHQPVNEPEDNREGEEGPVENPEERLARFRNEMLRNLPVNNQNNQRNEDQNEGQNEGQEQNEEENNATHDARTTKLVILKETKNGQEIQQNLDKTKACSFLESVLFTSESSKGAYEHDYARPVGNKDKAKAKSRKDPRNRQNRTSEQPRSRRQEATEEEEDDENEEEDNEANDQNEENETSDCSLDESDFSSADSTTDVSSEHSDWGSEHEQRAPNAPRGTTSGGETSAVTSGLSSKKKSSPKSKKRRAAQKCREKISLPNGDIPEVFIPSPWLSETIPRKTPYFPQIGDVLMYFKTGHEKYIELVEIRKSYKLNMREQHWMRKKNLEESTLVKVMDIKFEIRPPRLCVLKLSILNQSTSKPTGESLTIKYHDMNDVVDFLVLNQSFNSHKGKHWKKGDRIRCQIDDRWWKGTVNKVENGESPFLSIYVHWDNGDKEYLSPWDLENLDLDANDIEDGMDVPEDQLKKSLYIPTSEEWNNIGRESESVRISEALASIMELAIAEPYNYPVDLTAYPEYMVDVEYPMDLSCIKARVENHFYRRIDAIKNDLRYIYTNARGFNQPKTDIVRNASILSKVATEIVGDTSKTKDDVSAIYHRMVESFEWSSSESETEEEREGGNEEKPSNSRRRLAKKKSVSPNYNPKKWKHDCNELLNQMVALPFSEAFREPVSAIEFPDYHRTIATPMDLSTVRESLHIGDYNNPHDFQKDVRLIFKNSREYNTIEKSKILNVTKRLEEWFNEHINVLIHDWKLTQRRIGKKKSKGSPTTGNETDSPGYKGKGKGKGRGKGQSNNIKRESVKRRLADSSDEEDDHNDSDYDQPGPSKTSPRKKPISKPSRAAPPLRNAMTASNFGRRTSSRQTRLPQRFQDQSDEEDEDDQPPPRRVRPKDSIPPGPSTSRASIPDDVDDEEIPLAAKKSAGVKRKASEPPIVEDKEEEPLVKRSSNKKVAVGSDSEEDIPLAVRRKTSTNSSSSRRETPHVRHSSRPSRPNRRYEETESEPEQPRRRSGSSRSVNRKRNRDPSSSSGGNRRNLKRNNSRKSAKKKASMAAKKARRNETQSQESESESSSSSESTSSSGSSGSSSESEEPEQPRRQDRRKPQRKARIVQEESLEEEEEEIMPQRKRRQIDERNNRRGHHSASTSTSGGRRNQKRPVYFEGDEDEDDHPRGSRGGRPKRAPVKRRDLEEFDTAEVDPDEESTEEETASDDDEDQDSDAVTSREKAYLSKKKKKTTVTSRGRISKPNPRII